MKPRIRLIMLTVAVMSVLSGCSLNTRMDVQAQAGRPASAQVDTISIPYDSSKPKVALVVEPFRWGENSPNVTTFFSGDVNSVPVADKMAAQLTTAFAKVGNFVLYDDRASAKRNVRKGQKGPYIVRATLSEFNESAETASDSTKIALGWLGLIAGIAGAVAGEPALAWSGAGVAAANPSYSESEELRIGMVAFDVKIIEQSTGRIVTSFDASGMFKEKEASTSFGIFGFENSQERSASSVMGQALRIAMNEVVRKTAEAVE